MIAKEKLVRVTSLASLVLLLAAGCATQKYGEFEPKCELGQPNATAYASYGAAMAHVDGYQMAYEWQRANPKLVAEATKPEVKTKDDHSSYSGQFKPVDNDLEVQGNRDEHFLPPAYCRPCA